jgi:outer membrane lipoprotein LolB
MNSKSLFRLVALLCFSVLMTACHRNTIKPKGNITQWQKIEQWSFKGKMAINDGQHSGSGNLVWKVNSMGTYAQFKAALGQGSWRISATEKQATLESSQHGVLMGTDATTLIKQELGWEFPWQNLKFWVRGYANHQILSPHTELPKSFQDDGWTITYQKWMNTSLGPLPKKIKAVKDNYSVKLIIYNWDLQ